jgi:hypothetical protein
VKLTWRLNPEHLRRLKIGWPARYAWPPAHNWLWSIETGIRSHGVAIERREIRQPATSGTVIVEADMEGRRERIALDYTDPTDVDAETAASVLVYFKMNHSLAGYPQPNVIPGGYVTGSPLLYRYLWLLRRRRGLPRFDYDVYGRFGLRYEAELRRRAFELLSARDDFSYVGSLFRHEGAPEKTVSFRRYLFEIARSKVCIDLPSNSDLTFRFVECLAIGSCVVGPPHRVRLPVPAVNREHVVHCASDLSDLGDVCAELVHDDRERDRIARNARDYFDRYLHRRQLAAYYLFEICRRLTFVLGFLVPGLVDGQPGLLPC